MQGNSGKNKGFSDTVEKLTLGSQSFVVLKPVSLKIQRVLMWIPYLNLLAPWLVWPYQRKALGLTGWNKEGLAAHGLMFLIFLPTAILTQLFPDAVWIGWVGFYLAGLVPCRYLIRVQEKYF